MHLSLQNKTQNISNGSCLHMKKSGFSKKDNSWTGIKLRVQPHELAMAFLCPNLDIFFFSCFPAVLQLKVSFCWLSQELGCDVLLCAVSFCRVRPALQGRSHWLNQAKPSAFTWYSLTAGGTAARPDISNTRFVTFFHKVFSFKLQANILPASVFLWKGWFPL